VLTPGESTSEYDLYKTFQRDNTVVNVVSILAVLTVLLFTFMSAGMPILLIMVIQGVIWINFAVPALQQKNVFFLSEMIVSSIQMGANIDYAIVISGRFMELKDKMSKKDAIIETMNFAFPTIITSGTMLSLAGILIGQ
jgi:predicted RND superfamily exporter protein